MQRPITFITYEPSTFHVLVNDERELAASRDMLTKRFDVGNKSKPLEIDKTRGQAILTCAKTLGQWFLGINYLECMEYMHQPISYVRARDLQWFLSNRYTLFDGTIVDSKEELDKRLKRFTVNEFKEFLREHYTLDDFVKYLTTSDCKIDGWLHSKQSSRLMAGSIDGIEPLEAYLGTKKYGTSDASYNIAFAITNMPFLWSETDEGHAYWQKLSDKWRYHVTKLLQGTEQPLTKCT